MYINLFIITFILLIIGVFLLSISIIFSKKHEFPETSIGGNKNMKKLNITCAKHDEIKICKSKDCSNCHTL